MWRMIGGQRMSETAGQGSSLRLKTYPRMTEALGMEKRFQNALQRAFEQPRKPRKMKPPEPKWGRLTLMRLQYRADQ